MSKDEKAAERVAKAKAKTMADRIQRLLEERGMQVRAASRDAGLGPTYIYDFLMGRNLNPSVQAVQAIAKVLQTTVAYLVGEVDMSANEHSTTLGAAEMPIIGSAEHGAFRRLAAESSNGSVLRAPLSENHPEARHFALEVRDSAMGACREGPIEKGAYALCVDLADAGLVVTSGSVYAVRRSLDGGMTYETILRRARRSIGSTELTAESLTPQFEKITVKGELGIDQRAEIFAFGLIYGALRLFR